MNFRVSTRFENCGEFLGVFLVNLFGVFYRKLSTKKRLKKSPEIHQEIHQEIHPGIHLGFRVPFGVPFEVPFGVTFGVPESLLESLLESPFWSPFWSHFWSHFWNHFWSPIRIVPTSAPQDGPKAATGQHRGWRLWSWRAQSWPPYARYMSWELK